ncbi:hypothetical protein [Pseudodesulfovibrio karagichevae]|uniref:Replication protein n=1 Tax=Pseudodesulfovibrio karagichevae TaxID=3239305 RepID=A0ABV4K441_9BACT
MYPTNAIVPSSDRANSFAVSSGEAHQNNLNLNYGARNCHEAARLSDSDTPQKPLRPWPFGNARADPDRPHAKRDWLRSELAEKFPGVRWITQGEKGAWAIREAFKQAICKVEGIENDDPYRNRDEFLSCGSRKSWGTLVQYKDAPPVVSPFSCGKTPCPRCYDRGKERTTKDIQSFMQGSAKALGISSFIRIVFTLPEPVEAIPTKGSNERTLLCDGLQKLTRKACGLRLRDGLAAYCSVHAVGSRDLYKDRFHFHVGLIPIASVRKKNGETVVQHCDPGRIPHDWIKARWLQILQKVFPTHDLEDTPVVHLTVDHFDQPRISGILGHHLKYDGRGFGNDFLKAPLAFDPATSRVVIEAEQGGFHITTMEQLARRWKWVRGERDYRTWGILSQRKKYAPIIGVEHVVEPEPEIETEERVTVVRKFGKVWDKKKGIVWKEDKHAFFKGEEITGVEWGRKGGAEWRVIQNSFPDRQDAKTQSSGGELKQVKQEHGGSIPSVLPPQAKKEGQCDE